jgi:predicted outer membrane repeat protein
MAGFQHGSATVISTAQTFITIVGNGAVFDARWKDNFFFVGDGVNNAVALVMSNVTLQNGNSADGSGGAIFVGGTAILTDCIFTANLASYLGGTGGSGGAICVGGTATLTNCIFSGNTVYLWKGFRAYEGGALFFGPNSNGLLKNCSPLRHRISQQQ